MDWGQCFVHLHFKLCCACTLVHLALFCTTSLVYLSQKPCTFNLIIDCSSIEFLGIPRNSQKAGNSFCKGTIQQQLTNMHHSIDQLDFRSSI